MPQSYGAQLAERQDLLATLWQTEGPSAVHQALSMLPEYELKNMLMLVIGAQATSV